MRTNASDSADSLTGREGNLPVRLAWGCRQFENLPDEREGKTSVFSVENGLARTIMVGPRREHARPASRC